MTTSTTIDANHPEMQRGDAFCQKHFGNSLRDLGYEDIARRAIEAGENVTVALEEVAEEDGLDYLDGGWGHMKPNLKPEHDAWSGAKS